MNSVNIFAPKNTYISRKLGENNMERFNTDISINGVTKYQDKDNLIHSLQEELSTMKHKMSFYFEKEKEIQDLQQITKQLTDEIKSVDKYKLLILKLKRNNDALTEHYKKLLLELKDYDNIKRENDLLKSKIKEIGETNPIKETKSIDTIIEELSIQVSDGDEIEDIGDIKDNVISNDDH